MLKLMLPIFPPQTWFDSEKDMYRIIMMISDSDYDDTNDDNSDDDDSVNFNFRADHRAHIVKVV